MTETKLIDCNRCSAHNHSIFCQLSSQEKGKMALQKQYLFYKRGESLFKEGGFPKGLHCVNYGKIKVFQLGADGKEQIVHLIGEGNILGHRAIFGEDAYSCSAEALEDSGVCFIPTAELMRLMESNPKILLRIAKLLADELKEAEEKITQMAQKTVKQRIMSALADLNEKYGCKEDKQTLNVAIKREELANLAGTTRESATRLLYELQENRIISLDGKFIKILNWKALSRL